MGGGWVRITQPPAFSSCPDRPAAPPYPVSLKAGSVRARARVCGKGRRRGWRRRPRDVVRGSCPNPFAGVKLCSRTWSMIACGSCSGSFSSRTFRRSFLFFSNSCPAQTQRVPVMRPPHTHTDTDTRTHHFKKAISGRRHLPPFCTTCPPSPASPTRRTPTFFRAALRAASAGFKPFLSLPIVSVRVWRGGGGRG